MTPLEKVNSMKMPFAELKGVTFTEADKDRVVARMLVRPDLCTLNHTIHGGAVMAFADSVGAAATVINLPEDAKGTTTIESKTNFIGGAREGTTRDRHRDPGASGAAHPGLADAAGDRGGKAGRGGDPDPDGALNECPDCGVNELGRDLLPLFEAESGLEFHVAMHNIGGLGIRRLLEGYPRGDLT